MNAHTFLTNISNSLNSLEKQNNSLSENGEEIRKNIADLATLVQQQSNSFGQHIKLIEEDLEQLKSNQNDILNKTNEVLSRIENCSAKQSGSSTKYRKRKKIKSVDDLLDTIDASSESEAANDNKLNPYDLTPTLVALVRNKMKTNEQHEEDSDESIENEFSFNYSKPFTHKINQKVLKAYLIFYMKDYETRGDNLSNYTIFCLLLLLFIYLFYLLEKNEIWSEDMI